MNPIDVLLIVVVLAVVVVAARRFVGTARGTRDCCSGDATGAAPARRGSVAAVEVADTDPAHYPYEARLGIGGMTCEHCVATVTAALDGLGDTWATVELAGGQALVRGKQPLDEAALRTAIEAAGYRLVSFESVSA